MSTYSFLSVQGTIAGPGLLASIGNGSQASDEGITVKRAGEQNTMTPGADGATMNSLHAAKNGTIEVSLLKTSPVNAVLMQAFNLQTSNPAIHGQNVISVRDTYRGDVVTATGCAFAKFPDNAYGKEGAMMVWTFQCAVIDELLGTGSPSLV